MHTTVQFTHVAAPAPHLLECRIDVWKINKDHFLVNWTVSWRSTPPPRGRVGNEWRQTGHSEATVQYNIPVHDNSQLKNCLNLLLLFGCYEENYRCPISQIIRLKEGVIKNKNKNSDREKLSYTLFQRLHRWIQMQKKCMTEFSLGLIQKHAQKSRWSPLKMITSKSHAEHNNCWWMKDHLRASSSDRESCW